MKVERIKSPVEQCSYGRTNSLYIPCPKKPAITIGGWAMCEDCAQHLVADIKKILEVPDRMRLIAIDQATVTGWASWDGTHTESGVQNFKPKRGESPGMRYIRFKAWLREVCDLVRPGMLVYEEAHHRGGAATEIAYGLIGIIKKEAAARGIEHTSVHTTTLKHWATGNGRASKQDMIEAAIVEQLKTDPRGLRIIDDNRADALLMLAYTREQFEKADG